MMLPEDTPSYGEREFTYHYSTDNKDGSSYLCVCNFETKAKMLAHEQQVIQIKNPAAEANQRCTPAGVTTPDILFWLNFLVLVQ
jgi:hypothetical protein